MGAVEFLNDPGDFLFLYFLFVLFQLFHGLLDVLLAVGVGVEYVVVLVVEGL